jgi:hypothetical protein
MSGERETGLRLRWWLAGAAGVVALLAGDLVLWQVLDPDRPVRDLALADARAAAETDYAQVWRDYSPCYQRLHPEAAFVAEQEQPGGVRAYPAPADTTYSVVAVQPAGPYRRVEVRVQPPGFQQLDYEIDERMYGGRWVVVDRGGLGHPISDDCQRGGGS